MVTHADRPTRVGVYLRISEDRDGNQTATERQRHDCEQFAAARGWEMVDVFEDVDLSAFKRTVRRPEFERMLDAVRSKTIDGVMAWKIDRITRRQRDFVRLDEACEEAGGFIATVVDGIDTRQPTGRFVAELLVAQARMESENASIRIRRKHEEQAQRGQANTGGTRAFGLTRDRKHIVPEEAELIREAASRVLAGEALRGVCRDWDARGVKTPGGGRWLQSPLRRMLTSAALSGQREYGGRLIPGTWPAILTPEETERLRAVLRDPARNKVGPNPRRYLLTGLLRCGRCGEQLTARPRQDGTRRYVCARGPGRPNCGKLARMAQPVEDTVAEMVLSVFREEDLAELLRPADVGEESILELLRADEAALEALSQDHYVDRRIGRAEYFTARDALESRLANSRRRLAKDTQLSAIAQALGPGTGLADRWAAAGLEWRRALIMAVVDHVVIEPAVPGNNRFEAALVRPMWRF